MDKSYIVAYTLFGFGYNGFKTYFKVFNDYNHAINFIKYHPNIRNNYCLYESIYVTIN